MMKRIILFSFLLSLFAINVSTAQVANKVQTKERIEMQSTEALSSVQKNLNISLDRYELAVKYGDALEMKEIEGAIVAQMDDMLKLESDPAIKSAQTSLLKRFLSIDSKDKEQITSVLKDIREMKTK